MIHMGDRNGLNGMGSPFSGQSRNFSNLLNYLASIAALSISVIPAGAHSLASSSIAQTQAEAADWSTLFDRAADCESRDLYREAEILYRQILSVPRPASMNDYMYHYIHIQLGRNLQAQGQFTEAIDVLQGVLNAASEDADVRHLARNTLNEVLEEQQTSDQTIARGLQAIETDPTDPWGYRDLVTGLAIQGQLEQGLTFLESHLGHPLSPEQAIELARAATSSTVSGSRAFPIEQQAIKLYGQLVTRYPNDPQARREWLDVLDVWGTPEEAIAVYRAEIERQPSDERLYWQLARKLESIGQLTQAIEVYDRLIEQRPAEPRLYVALGDLLEQTQQPDRALQIYLQAIAAFPDDRPSDRKCHVVKTTSYDRLVRLLASQNRVDRAMAEIAQFNPNLTPEVYENLALALEYENYRELAAVVDRQLSDRYPDREPRESSGCSS